MSGNEEIQNTGASASQQPLHHGSHYAESPNHRGKSGRELEEIQTNMG